jgi:hypothetical protein
MVQNADTLIESEEYSRTGLRRSAESLLASQLRLGLQPVIQGMTITPPATFVKFVGTESNSFFDWTEASVQSAEECLPFFKAKERGELAAPLRVAFAVGPKRRENLLLACFDFAEHQQERVVILVVRQPRSQPNRSCHYKTVFFPARVVGVGVVNAVLEFLSAFLADAKRPSFGDGDGGFVNRNSLGRMVVGTTDSRGHRLNLPRGNLTRSPQKQQVYI